ncbi:MAG TPA: hypothetical protein VLT34_06035, partial [Arthrobacter sp.]|nr:hypothetical protein [Arthrobacter sp.]
GVDAGRTGPAGAKVSGVSVTAIPDDEPATGDAPGDDTSTQSIAVIPGGVAGPATGSGTAAGPAAAGPPAHDTSTTALTVVEARPR